MYALQIFPSHLQYVATLPSESLKFKNAPQRTADMLLIEDLI